MIQRTLSARHSEPVTIRECKSSDLPAGFSAPRIVRLDVCYSLSDGRRLTESFIQKTAGEAERMAMRLLLPIADRNPLPTLCGEGEDDLGPWILMPFICGTERREFSLPPDVLRTLAEVHVRFRADAIAEAGLPHVDAEFWESELDRLEKASETSPARSALLAGIGSLRDASVMEAVDSLPCTLLHGDVHPGNIIHRAGDGREVLLDWGNARLGPEGIDLANCISRTELPSWQRYWELVEELSQSRVGDAERARQFHVGKVFVSVQYLPFAIEHATAEQVARLMRAALDACATLS